MESSTDHYEGLAWLDKIKEKIKPGTDLTKALYHIDELTKIVRKNKGNSTHDELLLEVLSSLAVIKEKIIYIQEKE